MRKAILGMALAALALAAPAAQQGGGIPQVVRVEPSRLTARAGEPFEATLDVRIGADAPGDASILIDGVGILDTGFVTRGFRTSLFACPTFRCVPCPAARQCFNTSRRIIDPRLPPGRHFLPFTITDSLGRTLRDALEIEIEAAADEDADGLPDAWERTYGVDPRVATGDDGPDGDPDGDGVRNRDELTAWTAPRGRYRQLFAEASSGDRPPGVTHCFDFASPVNDFRMGWLTLIGDDNRRMVTRVSGGVALSGACALEQSNYPADRVVAAFVESEQPIVAERSSASYGVEAPSRRWLFADGGTDGELDTFYLAYNPNATPAVARFSYRLPDGRVALQKERELAPGHRTTVWVNADDAALGRREASVEVEASAPILLERAWRFNPPGRTVTQASARPGASAPATRWLFGEIDPALPFESALIVANPDDQAASLAITFYFADREPVRLGRLQIPSGGRVSFPARQMGVLGGEAAAIEVTSTNGVGVVAERRYSGTDQYGPWRETVAGLTETGAQWTVAAVYGYAQAIAIVNTSPFPARVQLDYWVRSHSGENDSTRVLEIPARRRFLYLPSKDSRTQTVGTVRMKALPDTEGRLPELFVERFLQPRPDGPPRSRPAVLPGSLVR
jgi:hypothetical protein